MLHRTTQWRLIACRHTAHHLQCTRLYRVSLCNRSEVRVRFAPSPTGEVKMVLNQHDNYMYARLKFHNPVKFKVINDDDDVVVYVVSSNNYNLKIIK